MLPANACVMAEGRPCMRIVRCSKSSSAERHLLHRAHHLYINFFPHQPWLLILAILASTYDCDTDLCYRMRCMAVHRCRKHAGGMPLPSPSFGRWRQRLGPMTFFVCTLDCTNILLYPHATLLVLTGQYTSSLCSTISNLGDRGSAQHGLSCKAPNIRTFPLAC